MTKKIFFIILISFSVLFCTINVNAKELRLNSSINTLQIHHVLADEDNEDEEATVEEVCESVFGDPSKPETTAWLIQKVVGYMRLVGILLLLALSSFDFLKAIILNDADGMKKAKDHLLTRILGVLLLFMLPMLVKVLMEAFGFYNSCGTNVFNGFILNPFVGLRV